MGLDDILPKKSAMIDFNPQLAEQTGKYGHAKVWSKDRGFWGNATPVQAAVAVDTNMAVQQLQAQITALINAQAATVTQPVIGAEPTQATHVEAAVVVEGAPPDPFAG
jgi:hypothetical protein